MKEQLHALVTNADVHDLMKAIERRFISWRNPGRQTRFRDLLSVPYMTDATRISPVRSSLHRLDRENGTVYLRLPGHHLQFPKFLASTLRYVLECDSCLVAEIPGLAREEERVALVKQLLAAGVLQLVCERSRPPATEPSTLTPCP